MTCPWNGHIVGERNPADAAVLRERPIGRHLGVERRHIAKPHREDDLRLVVQVAAQCGGTDAGGPEQLRSPQGVAGDHDERRRHRVGGAAAHVPHLDADGPSAVDQDAGDEGLVVEREVRVRAGDVAEHHVRPRPDEPAVVTTVHRQRHPLHARGVDAPRVDGLRQALAHQVAERRAVERVGRHAEQPLGVVEQLVEVGEERDALAAARARARRRPVRGHPADVARHRRDGQPVLARVLVPVLEEERARAREALAALDGSRVADGLGRRRRPLRGELRGGCAGRDPRCS